MYKKYHPSHLNKGGISVSVILWCKDAYVQGGIHSLSGMQNKHDEIL